MTVSPQMLTLMALDAKGRELQELSYALSHRMTGNPQIDQMVQLELRNMYAEATAIAARRTALIGGGHFTPPSPVDVQNLQNAIAAVHGAIMNSANVNILIQLGVALLSTYGAAGSV